MIGWSYYFATAMETGCYESNVINFAGLDDVEEVAQLANYSSTNMDSSNSIEEGTLKGWREPCLCTCSDTSSFPS